MDTHFPSLNRSVSNLRNQRISETEIMDRIGFLSKRVMDLETVISQKNKEIWKLEATNKQLTLGNQKRDELIAAALYENRKLKEKLRTHPRKVFSPIKEREEDTSPDRSLSRASMIDSKSVDLTKTFGSMRNSLLDERMKGKVFRRLLEDDAVFVERFSSMDFRMQQDFLEHIRTQEAEFNSLVELTLRLKRLILAAYNISVSLVFNEAVSHFIKEACIILKCDRASVFLVDEVNEELWTKGASGTNETIRISMNQGLVGFVAKTGKPLNIEDAYKDSRFNSAVDQQTNYHTRTVLVVPVRDTNGKVIGVCQAINKMGGIFTPDDEALFEMLAANAGVMLRNALLNESALLMQDRIQALSDCILELLTSQTLSQFNTLAIKCAMSLISSTEGKMYLVKEEILQEITPGGQLVDIAFAGLAGHCVTVGHILNISDAYYDALFNSKVDIATSMPVIVLPVIDSLGNVVAVIELVNSRGVLGRATTRKAKLDPLDTQILQEYAGVVASVLERLFPRRNSDTLLEA